VSTDPTPATRAVTLDRVARRAGVHVSTVSRALNPLQSGRVSAATVERIQAIAAELGFEPNPWARSLRTNRTMLLGLIIPRLTDGIVAAMFDAAEERARDHGYQALTVSTHDDAHEQERIVRALLDRRVDGIILATCRASDGLPEQLESESVPFVLMNRSRPSYRSVRADDEYGGYLATRHLLELGHRRIGMIAGPGDTLPTIHRRKGYVRAHAEAGVPTDAKLIVQSRIDMHSGVSTARELLALPKPPTAIFAINDAAAIGAMGVAAQLGWKVPDDLAIVGYNDFALSAMLPIPLTSVAVPLEDMGRQAVDVLVKRINGEPSSDVVLPVELRVRASTQP
jgi:LacI family transcriptional regulator